MVARHGSLSSHDLVSHSSSKSPLAYTNVTLTKVKGMVDHSTILLRAYSGDLIYYLVPLELDHVDHTISTPLAGIKVTKVDLTTGMQRLWPYQHIQQFIQLPPTWLGKAIDLISAHQTFKPL